VRENRTHGSIGGRWGGITDVAEMSEKPSGQRSTALSRITKPAAYLTSSDARLP
jgi:hypothetical protein